MRSSRNRVVLVLAGLLFVGLVGGCDGREASVEQAEAFLKERSSPRGKAGMLRALEVVHGAHRVADRHGEAEEPDCRLRVPEEGAYSYKSTLTLERTGDGGRGLHWYEIRTTDRDESGAVRVTLSAESRSELGIKESHEMSWRLIDGTSYVSADADSFYARPAELDERDRIEAVGLGTLQTLLDAADDGWQRDEESRRSAAMPHLWQMGGDRLVCGPSDGQASGWLRRLAAHARSVSGRLKVSQQRVEAASSAASRTLDLRWQLDDRTTLRARFEDRLRVGDAPDIAAPQADDVVAVERDRSLEAVDNLFDRLAGEQAIEKFTEQTSDESDEATGKDDESK